MEEEERILADIHGGRRLHRDTSEVELEEEVAMEVEVEVLEVGVDEEAVASEVEVEEVEEAGGHNAIDE